ncbi:Pyrophosphate-energized vacuolar membrane proton pump 1 [Hibiscus syriacus]|uniref:H(+)-exporting diphosphatase n=1 Tax=Hibiscus syriacus TaxID=106335 RepID=A0A6A2ZAK7_HIBSY|nr:Pyrophosphate-energized vacuolar membrane proton pump 1 [Hibiscus syriacus]
MSALTEGLTQILILVAALLGIGFSLLQWFLVSRVKLTSNDSSNGVIQKLIESDEEEEGVNQLEMSIKCAEIQHAISVGELPFLLLVQPPSCILNTSTLVSSWVYLLQSFSSSLVQSGDSAPKVNRAHTTREILANRPCALAGLTSVLSGFLGMKIATYANARTTLGARKGIGKAFITAFRAGAVMGFLLAANGLLVLFVSINLFKLYYGDDWEGLYESITGYGLGGSSMALFGRVGGGIYTKAADVGADLVGKVEQNIPEDDPRNPAVIADNVGDNVGDIAGMGSDLFGSYAESSCAALFVASISSFGVRHEFTAMSYPLLISSMGIVVCLITTLFATDLFEIKNVSEIEPSLKRQLLISTVLMTAGIAVVSFFALPSEFTLFNFGTEKAVKNWHLFFCVATGLWAGTCYWLFTEYYTSNAYSPVQDVADACRTGAATNVIFGLALGYKSVIIPIFAIAIAIYVSFRLAAMYGIAVAALGMLKMAGMSHKIRERTDALDAAGNTTAAIGKGFAIGSAALVSLALFGAYVSRAGINSVNVLTPKAFIGLIVGAMLPYWFSAMTMKSVGTAALKMVEEVRRQFKTIPGTNGRQDQTDYANCVKISTDASLREMIPPGALVAISASNTGGAGIMPKKYIEAGVGEHAKSLGPKGSECHKAAVIGDTIGDPLKDTSGPSLNILISSWLLSLWFLPLSSPLMEACSSNSSEFQTYLLLHTRRIIEFPFTEEDVWLTIKSSDGSRAPGSDGFSLDFFKRFWNDIKGEVMSFMDDFYWSRVEDFSFNKSFIALIPKKVESISPDDFRPISLVGSMYKIVSRVLAKRMPCCISEVIGENQFAFIASKQIEDCILISNKVIDGLSKSKALSGMFKKAFDIGLCGGVEVGSRGVALSHIQFADDLLICSEEKESSILNFNRVLKILKASFDLSGTSAKTEESSKSMVAHSGQSQESTSKLERIELRRALFEWEKPMWTEFNLVLSKSMSAILGADRLQWISAQDGRYTPKAYCLKMACVGKSKDHI